MATSGFLAPFPWQDGEPPDTMAIPENWIDSDVVADTAEFYGGGEFRNNHPNADVGATLMTIQPDKGSLAVQTDGFFPHFKPVNKKSDLCSTFMKESLMQNSQPFWLFQ